MSLKVGTRKRTNPSIPPQLSFALGLLGFSSFCWGQPVSTSVPGNSLLNASLSTTGCKMPALLRTCSLQLECRLGPKRCNLQFAVKLTAKQHKNIMLHSLLPPNTHPCAKGNNPPLQEVPPKPLTLFSFLTPGVFSRKATT